MEFILAQILQIRQILFNHKGCEDLRYERKVPVVKLKEKVRKDLF